MKNNQENQMSYLFKKMNEPRPRRERRMGARVNPHCGKIQRNLHRAAFFRITTIDQIFIWIR